MSELIYLLAAVLFILSIRGLSAPRSARLGNFLGILDDITDIAAPQAQSLGGNHGVLRGDHGVLGRDGKVAQTRRAAGRLTRALDKLGLKAAHVLKQIDPLGIIDRKY